MAKKMGRPRKDLEDMKFDGWDLLEESIIWASEAYCAEKLGITVQTLEDKIRQDFGMTFLEYKDQKMQKIKKDLRMKQYEVAMKGNVVMLIWLGKNLLTQFDKSQTDVSIQEKVDPEEVGKQIIAIAEQIKNTQQ